MYKLASKVMNYRLELLLLQRDLQQGGLCSLLWISQVLVLVLSLSLSLSLCFFVPFVAPSHSLPFTVHTAAAN